MRRRRLHAFGLLLASACGAFSEGATPADAGDGSDSDASSPDSGPASDSGPTLDGGAAEGSIADAVVPDFQTELCDDFERNTPKDSRWTDILVEPQATLTISDTRAVSVTRSLLVDLLSSQAEDRRAYLERTLVAPAPHVKLRMKLFVEKKPTDGVVYIAQMLTGNGSIHVALDDAGLFAQSSATGGSDGPTARSALTTGTWQDVSFEYFLVPPTVRLKVGTNGAAQASGSNGSGLVQRVELGSAFASMGDSAKFFIDDVCLDRGN